MTSLTYWPLSDIFMTFLTYWPLSDLFMTSPYLYDLVTHSDEAGPVSCPAMHHPGNQDPTRALLSLIQTGKIIWLGSGPVSCPAMHHPGNQYPARALLSLASKCASNGLFSYSRDIILFCYLNMLFSVNEPNKDGIGNLTGWGYTVKWKTRKSTNCKK